jgi:hypothetical protein
MDKREPTLRLLSTLCSALDLCNSTDGPSAATGSAYGHIQRSIVALVNDTPELTVDPDNEIGLCPTREDGPSGGAQLLAHWIVTGKWAPVGWVSQDRTGIEGDPEDIIDSCSRAHW